MNEFKAVHRPGLATGVVLLLAMMLATGCSDDDKKSSSGGGTTIITPQFPEIPDELPTLFGMVVAIDVSGGNGSLGGNGGHGGEVGFFAPAGRVMADDERPLPEPGNNFLTAAVLADNVVTVSELMSIAPERVTSNGSMTIIDVIGANFMLPPSATLDLSDSPTQSVVIRSLDARPIHLGGNVNGARAGTTANLILWTAAPGTAIALAGTVNMSGSASAADAGSMSVIATQGDILIRGTFLATGATPASGRGGEGGVLMVQAAVGDILLSEGVWQANGGDGGDAGRGGGARVECSKSTDFRWGFRANGGNTPGVEAYAGDGGQLDVRCSADLRLFLPFEVNGGEASGSVGGWGGEVYVNAINLTGACAGDANGGDGQLDGGWGGNVELAADNMAGVALVARANGGDASASAIGGRGGWVRAYLDGFHCVNVLVEVEALGGSAGGGGEGGNVGVGGYAFLRNVHLNADVRGGVGSSDRGGRGGEAYVTIDSWFGESMESVFIDCVVDGGSGVSGGDGGRVWIEPAGGHDNVVEAHVFAVGGNGSSGDGGEGGALFIGSGESAGNWSLDLRLSGALSGGESVAADGGAGGFIDLLSYSYGGWVRLNTVGDVLLRGGAARGEGRGGIGGRVRVFASEWKHFDAQELNLDMRGGDSDEGDGGPAASSGRAGGNPGFVALCGSIRIAMGTINMTGGTGSVVSGNGNGGDGGEAVLYTQFGDIDFGATLLLNGGNGPGGGGDAVQQGVSAEVSADINGIGIAGAIRISGVIEANGGHCTGSDGTGGHGGMIWLNNYWMPESSGGAIMVSGRLESVGGNSVGARSSGGSWGVYISSSGVDIDLSGVLLSQGGTGDFGGWADGVFVYGGGRTRIVISGSLEVIAGDGVVAGYDGGNIFVGGLFGAQAPASIAVTDSGVLRSVAGAGGTTNGNPGFIELDAEGTGGANISIAPGAVVEVLDANHDPVPGNVTTD